MHSHISHQLSQQQFLIRRGTCQSSLIATAVLLNTPFCYKATILSLRSSHNWQLTEQKLRTCFCLTSTDRTNNIKNKTKREEPGMQSQATQKMNDYWLSSAKTHIHHSSECEFFGLKLPPPPFLRIPCSARQTFLEPLDNSL